MGKAYSLPFSFALTDLFFFSATEIMWRAKATERLKLRAAEIEAATEKEVAARGLVPASSGGEGTQSAPEVSAARAPVHEAVGDATSSASVGVEILPIDYVPLRTRKKRRTDPTPPSVPSGEQLSERSGNPPKREEGAPASVEALSLDRTPSQLGLPAALPEVEPTDSLPRTRRRLRRLGDLSTIGGPSDQAAETQDDPSGVRVIKTILRFPSEEYLLAVDRPASPEQQITLTGPLAKVWEDARIRVALMTPSQLGDSNLQQATGVCSFSPVVSF